MIRTAILLAAGEGSRLRDVAASKPLAHVAGHALIDHAVANLAAAGIARVVVVLGYRGEAVAAHLATTAQPLKVDTVHVADHLLPNGVSALAAAPLVAGGAALLAMCDHLAEPALYARVAAAGPAGGARLAIDRRLDSDLVDLDDVTCVRTDGVRIVDIGKGLADYDCFDTGVFAVAAPLFDALGRLEAPSLTHGMRALAADGHAEVVDASDLAWVDVDDAPALAKAEALWRGR